MFRRLTSLVAISLIGAAVPAAPALAQSVFQTHAEHPGPGGKVPTKAYRPLAQDTCRSARNFHQTGKIPLTPQVAASTEGCLTQVAARDTDQRKD